MSSELNQYRQLEQRLWMTRWRNGGNESEEEDAILDEMEMAWRGISDSERATLKTEGPRCWPMDVSSMPPQLPDAPFASEPTPWAYEGFASPAEAILSKEAA